MPLRLTLVTMKNEIARKKAFTLVELAVAMAVTAVFLALTSVLLATVINEKKESDQDSQIAYEYLLLHTRIEKWYESCSSIDVENGQDVCTFLVTTELDENYNEKRTFIARRDGKDAGWLCFDNSNQSLSSSDAEWVDEFDNVTNVSFEVFDQTIVKVTVTFNSFENPVVYLFTQSGLSDVSNEG